jgi:hypothetical protein
MSSGCRSVRRAQSANESRAVRPGCLQGRPAQHRTISFAVRGYGVPSSRSVWICGSAWHGRKLLRLVGTTQPQSETFACATTPRALAITPTTSSCTDLRHAARSRSHFTSRACREPANAATPNDLRHRLAEFGVPPLGGRGKLRIAGATRAGRDKPGSAPLGSRRNSPCSPAHL